MTPFEFAKTNADRFEQELFDLLRIPSVSTNATYADEVKRAAHWVGDNLREMGLTVEIIETERHPIVYAEWLQAGDDARTVLIYGHYDVQPAVMSDGWTSNPFEPVVQDGKVYARGATDDKGQMFTHLKAVESILKTEGALPVNVKFVLEGEEESGSTSLGTYLPAHVDKLAADVCVISDTSMPNMDEPSIVSSLRGMFAFELHVTGPSRDLHSGMYGGTVHNPLQALAEILSKLHDETGAVAVPGFYDDVVRLSDDERALISVWPETSWHDQTGAPQPYGEPGYSLRERVGIRPTLEINGMAGGYYEKGFKTVLPSKAIAKISCRLVANQDPKKIEQAIVDYLAQITPPTVMTEFITYHGQPAAMMDIHSPMMQAAVNAYEKQWGATPSFEHEGGSIPIVSALQTLLDIPIILMGFGLHSDGLHGPDEHFTLAMFHKGIATSAQFLYEVAALGD